MALLLTTAWDVKTLKGDKTDDSQVLQKLSRPKTPKVKLGYSPTLLSSNHYDDVT